MSNQTSFSKTTILTQAMKERFSETTTTCLHNLIDSAFLDAGEMANDCLEFFDNYQWEPESTLNEIDLGR